MAIKSKKCIVCGSSGISQEVVVGKWNFARCSNCELVFLDKFPSSSELGKIYSYKGDGDLSKLNSALYFFYKIGPLRLMMHALGQWVNKKRIEAISEFRKGRLLDVGAGPGEFMMLASKYGWDAHGTEVSKKLVDALSQQFGKNKVSQGELFNINFGRKKFDLVTMWHVFEHVPNFSKLVLSFGRVTTKDANIIIEVPHANSFNFKIFRENWVLLLTPQHLHFWTRQSFQSILNRNGIYIKKVEYPWHFPFVFFSSIVKKYPYSFLLFPMLIPFSVCWSIAISCLGRGDVIRVYASR